MQLNNKYTITKPSASAVLFILSMIIVCTRDYGDLHLTQMTLYLQYGIGFLWIIAALIQLYLKKSVFHTQEDKDAFWFLKIYFLPQVVFYVYSIIIILLGFSSWQYLGTNLTSFIPILLSIIAYYFYKEKALKYICVSIVVSWFISVTFALVQNGISIVSQAIIQGYFDAYYTSSTLARANYFEIHDIVLGIGYFIVFYYYARINRNTKEKRWSSIILVLFIIMSLLGIKRVAALGVLLALIFRAFVKKYNKKSLRICLISGWLALFICIAFIYVFGSGNEIFRLLYKVGITPAGRDRYYTAVLNMTKFSPTWLGLGRGAVAKLFNTKLAYLNVGGVHSDLIKIYAENGFVLYIWWLWYFLVHNTKEFAKRFNVQAAIVYFGITIYMFVLYTTDNTDVYFACQMLNISIPIAFATWQRKKTNIDMLNEI